MTAASVAVSSQTAQIIDDFDFLSPAGDFKSNHSATVAEIPGQKLIACWYAGSNEGSPDAEIYCRTKLLDVGAKNWGSRITAVHILEKTKGNLLRNNTVGNPVLYFDDHDQTLYLFYAVRTFGGWAVSEVAYKSSRDFGQSWNQGKILESRGERRFGGRLPRALPLELSAGKILLPLYYDLKPKAGFTCQLDLDRGDVSNKICIDIPGEGQLQPTLVQLDSQIYAYLRTQNSAGKIETASMDITNGYTTDSIWERSPNLTLPNPGSSIAANITADHKILLVHNTETGRNFLNLAISIDGKNFKEVYSFEKDPLNTGTEFSYPTLFKDSNGVFHMLYTYHGRDAIKYISFTEEWVKSKLD
jgi:predicted neuraminidase